MKKQYDYYIGIDVSRPCGWAVWDVEEQKLLRVDTLKVHQLFKHLEGLTCSLALFFVEDARKRKWYGDNAKAKVQGAGAVKALTSDVERALKDYGYDYKLIAPKHNVTKMKAGAFNKLTGWEGRTSEHARDAAMLVFGRK